MGKRTVFALVAAAAALTAGGASAATFVSVQYGAPAYVQPQPVYGAPGVARVAPVQRVYVPGHWEWRGTGHVWVHGRTRPATAHRVLRDRDRDGVPNRWDRAPGNPYRY